MVQPELRPGGGHDVLGGEAELGLQHLHRRGLAEGAHPDHGAGRADPAVPAERAALLHRDPGRHRGRQDLLAVGGRLLVEQLHRRHAHHPRPDPVGGELLVGVDGHPDLAAGGDEDDVGVALGRVGEDVGAAGDPGRGGVAGAVQGRQRLAGEHQRHRLVPDRHEHAPRLDDLVGVAGPHVDHAGHGADRGEVLDRLVGRPVLAHADRVVGVDVDQRELHQRGEPQGAALEVGEDEEPGLVGAQLGQREPVGDRGGGVLAHPEVQVAPGPVVRAEVARAVEGQPRLVRRRQVRRPADQPRHRVRRPR